MGRPRKGRLRGCVTRDRIGTEWRAETGPRPPEPPGRRSTTLVPNTGGWLSAGNCASTGAGEPAEPGRPVIDTGIRRLDETDPAAPRGSTWPRGGRRRRRSPTDTPGLRRGTGASVQAVAAEPGRDAADERDRGTVHTKGRRRPFAVNTAALREGRVAEVRHPLGSADSNSLLPPSGRIVGRNTRGACLGWADGRGQSSPPGVERFR